MRIIMRTSSARRSHCIPSMTILATDIDPARSLPQLVAHFRLDESMGNLHTGADVERVVALSRYRFAPKGTGRAYRVATLRGGELYLARKGRDGIYFPVAPLRYLSAAGKEVA